MNDQDGDGHRPPATTGGDGAGERGGYPAWIRTMNNASKGRCVTVTPRGNWPVRFQKQGFMHLQVPQERLLLLTSSDTVLCQPVQNLW